MQVAKNREIVTNNEEILYTGYDNYARKYHGEFLKQRYIKEGGNYDS